VTLERRGHFGRYIPSTSFPDGSEHLRGAAQMVRLSVVAEPEPDQFNFTHVDALMQVLGFPLACSFASWCPQFARINLIGFSVHHRRRHVVRCSLLSSLLPLKSINLGSNQSTGLHKIPDLVFRLPPKRQPRPG